MWWQTIDFRWSDLLLSGLVGHFDIRETLSAACRVSHTCDLQQALPLHGRNEGSCCVPWSCPHLGCMRQDQHSDNLQSCCFLSQVWLRKGLDQYLVINLHLEVLLVLFLWSKEGFLPVSSILERYNNL